MENMTPQQRAEFIHERVCEILKAFDEFQGKDISTLTIEDRDKYIEGRIVSDLAASDEFLVQLHNSLKLYEAHSKRVTNTAALLFLINGINLECPEVDVAARIEKNDSARPSIS